MPFFSSLKNIDQIFFYRRAGLREMMSGLRALIPVRNGMEKLTMLQLLKYARHHIRVRLTGQTGQTGKTGQTEQICKTRLIAKTWQT